MDGYGAPPAGPAAQAGFNGGYAGPAAYDAEPNQQIMVRNVSELMSPQSIFANICAVAVVYRKRGSC
jgi:hypothetical protein